MAHPRHPQQDQDIDTGAEPRVGDRPPATGEPDPPVGAENLDPRENLLGDDPDEVMQTGYDPPEREPHSLRDPLTAAEDREGPPTEERLAEEEPDVGELSGTGTAGDPQGNGNRAAGVEAVESADVIEPSGPDPRAGRLVAPDGGTQEHPPDAPDELASDRGPAGYASSAEEAAVHIVEPDERS